MCAVYGTADDCAVFYVHGDKVFLGFHVLIMVQQINTVKCVTCISSISLLLQVGYLTMM